jgi:hypothetical protein
MKGTNFIIHTTNQQALTGKILIGSKKSAIVSPQVCKLEFQDLLTLAMLKNSIMALMLAKHI